MTIKKTIHRIQSIFVQAELIIIAVLTKLLSNTVPGRNIRFLSLDRSLNALIVRHCRRKLADLPVVWVGIYNVSFVHPHAVEYYDEKELRFKVQYRESEYSRRSLLAQAKETIGACKELQSPFYCIDKISLFFYGRNKDGISYTFAHIEFYIAANAIEQFLVLPDDENIRDEKYLPYCTSSSIPINVCWTYRERLKDETDDEWKAFVEYKSRVLPSKRTSTATSS